MTALTETAENIRNMQIRGAGKIARAAAGALKEEALSINTKDIKEFNKKMDDAYRLLYSTRPTAVSLPNALRAVMRERPDNVEDAKKAIVRNADEFIVGSENAVKRIGEIGAHRIKDGDTILTHCNSSAAFSIFEMAVMEQKKNIHVIATETRPRHQGYITVDFLRNAGIQTTLILDSAVRYSIKKEKVDLVIVGADAITVNGSLVNKVGTSQVALAANEARVNFICAAETYKFSPCTMLGGLVKIEERDPSEVVDLDLRSKWKALQEREKDIAREYKNNKKEYEGFKVSNPSFDITPHKYIDIIITEIGAISPEMAYWVINNKFGWKLEEISDICKLDFDDEE